MKLFIKKIFIFVLTIGMLFTLSEILFGGYNAEPIHYSLQYREAYARHSAYDGIIFGSSHGIHAFRPSLLDTTGIAFFNYSFNAAGPGYYAKWLPNIYLKYHNYPKYLVYAVDYFMFDRGRLWRHFEDDGEYFSRSDYLSILFSAGNYDREILLLSRPVIFRGGKAFFSHGFNNPNRTEYPVNEYDRGFVPYDIPYDAERWQPISLSTIKDDELLKKDFEDIIRDFLNHEVKVWFVSTPEYGTDSSFYKGSSSFRFISQLSGKYGIPFYNFNTSLRSSFNDSITNFADWGHLSRQGSITFSQRFSAILKSSLE
jgi:hypothetical protein